MVKFAQGTEGLAHRARNTGWIHRMWGLGRKKKRWAALEGVLEE